MLGVVLRVELDQHVLVNLPRTWKLAAVHAGCHYCATLDPLCCLGASVFAMPELVELLPSLPLQLDAESKQVLGESQGIAETAAFAGTRVRVALGGGLVVMIELQSEKLSESSHLEAYVVGSSCLHRGLLELLGQWECCYL